MGEAADVQNRITSLDVQELGVLSVTGAGLQQQIGVAQRDAELILQQGENVPGEVPPGQTGADVAGEIGEVHRNRFTVEITDPLDLEHLSAPGELERLLHI